MNIIETRYILAEDIRALCIKKKWYTRGTSEAYGKLLKDYDNVTAEGIYDIALDIIAHSGIGTISDTMFELGRITFSTFKVVAEGNELKTEPPAPKSRTLQEWADATEHDDRAALEDILEGESYKDLRYYGPEICDMLLKYHGHGMSTNRLKHLADTYLR